MKKRCVPGGIREQEMEYEKTFEELAGKDNPPVDERLVEEIENGAYTLEDGTPGTHKFEDGTFVPTDNQFILLVKESPGYLRERPFQNVLSEWFIKGDRNAIDRLWWALENPGRGKGRPAKLSVTREGIHQAYNQAVQLLQAFLDDHKGQIAQKKIENWKQTYPDLPIPRFSRHRTAGELAKDFICKRFGISKRTLENKLSARSINR